MRVSGECWGNQLYGQIYLLPAAFSFDAVGDGIFFYMEADFGFGRGRGRLKQGAELLVDVAECAIVQEEGFINFGEALEDGGVGGEIFAHFDEGADDVNAHGHRTGAVEHSGNHQCALLGEGADLLGELELGQGYHSL